MERRKSRPVSAWRSASSRTRGLSPFFSSRTMPVFARWRAERELQRKAATYVAALFHEPAPADVEWLTANATRGDVDHAQWELRYARRALGLIAAQRDALNDRTASVVAREISEAFARDQHIA